MPIDYRMKQKLLSIIKKYRYPETIKGKDLAALLSTERKFSDSDVRTLVRELRRELYPIASCGKGYYYAASEEQYEPTLKHLRSRALSELVTYNKAKKAFAKAEQIRLEL